MPDKTTAVHFTAAQYATVMTALEDYEDYLGSRNTEQDYDAGDLDEMRELCAECLSLVNEAAQTLVMGGAA